MEGAHGWGQFAQQRDRDDTRSKNLEEVKKTAEEKSWKELPGKRVARRKCSKTRVSSM